MQKQKSKPMTKKKAKQMLLECTHMINDRDLEKYTDFGLHKTTEHDGEHWRLKPGATHSKATSFTRQELLEILEEANQVNQDETMPYDPNDPIYWEEANQ